MSLCAALLSITTWLPWLTTSFAGGGRASAIGGAIGSISLPSRFGTGQLIVLLSSLLVVAGAMVARNLSPRLAAVTALALSLVIAILTWFYYRLNVQSPVVAGYGLYLGAVFAVASVVCAAWALIGVFLGGRRIRRP